MASSQVVRAEVGYAVRMLLSLVPPLRAPAEQRSDYQLLKAEIYDLIAATNPSVAVQASIVAEAARREARIIALDF